MRELNLQEMGLVSGGKLTEAESEILVATSVFVLASMGLGSTVGAVLGNAAIGGLLGAAVISSLMLIAGYSETEL